MAGDSLMVAVDDGICLLRTKPCWICGQYSLVHMPFTVWEQWEQTETHLDEVWPDGSPEDRQLLRTGVHPKCWDEEFPDNEPKEDDG